MKADARAPNFFNRLSEMETGGAGGFLLRCLLINPEVLNHRQ